MIPDLARVAAEAEPEELPALVGALAQAQAVALARLTTPHPEPSLVSEAPGELLTPAQAAEAIGGVSPKWLYRHTKGLRFRRDLSRKVVRFERAGLLRWMATKRA